MKNMYAIKYNDAIVFICGMLYEVCLFTTNHNFVVIPYIFQLKCIWVWIKGNYSTRSKHILWFKNLFISTGCFQYGSSENIYELA